MQIKIAEVHNINLKVSKSAKLVKRSWFHFEHHRTVKKMLPTSVFHLPKQAMQTPPSPMAKGPPQVRNLPSGAQAAVSDKAPTTPPVTAAARRTKGPPSNIIGAIRVPIKALWPAKLFIVQM